jgi:hypothetical protein
MKAVDRRLSRLEDRFAPAHGPNLLVLTLVGSTLALDRDTCIPILREGGFTRPRGFFYVDLLHIFPLA